MNPLPPLFSIPEQRAEDDALSLLTSVAQCTKDKKTASDTNALAHAILVARFEAADTDKPKILKGPIRPLLVGLNLLLFTQPGDRKLPGGGSKIPYFAVDIETQEPRVIGILSKKRCQKTVEDWHHSQSLSKEAMKNEIECYWNKMKQSFFLEAALMRRLQRDIPEVVQIHSLYTSEEECGIVMEACLKGDLLSRINEKRGSLSFFQKDQIARDIVKGVNKLHERDVLHCDLKPENIFLTSDYRGKIGDLGLARKCNHPPTDSIVGTDHYISPERCKEYLTLAAKKDKAAISPTIKSDLWALGTTLFELFAENILIPTPFDAVSIEVYQTISKLEQSFLNKEIKKEVPPAYQALVKGLLQVDPNKRISGAEAVALLDQIPQS